LFGDKMGDEEVKEKSSNEYLHSVVGVTLEGILQDYCWLTLWLFFIIIHLRIGLREAE
jgi:predicted transcriptional regulator